MTLIIRFLCRRSFYFFFLVLPPPPRSTLFPYTTLFRSLYPFGWRDDVTAAAQRTGLDPFLVAAVVREESSYYPRAVSRTGARGLMQLQPSTARPMAEHRGLAFAGGELPDDPRSNIDIGPR